MNPFHQIVDIRTGRITISRIAWAWKLALLPLLYPGLKLLHVALHALGIVHPEVLP